jgi:hypothetical protein
MFGITFMHGANFKSVSDAHAPAFKGPFLGFNDRRGMTYWCAQAKAWQRNYFRDTAVMIKEGNVNSKAHANGVHTSALWKNERSVKALTTEKTVTAFNPVIGNVGTGQNTPGGHDPSFSGHDARSSQNLGLN